MEPSTGTVEEALELAKRGMAYEACERLWPLVRDPETRDEAVFTLAYCFERANNLPTAAYLYGWVADRHPEFNVAARRVAKCRAELEGRGLHEDFSDSGHVGCPCGLFRYRAELGLCPYCGQTPGGSAGGDDAHAAPEAVAEPEFRSDEALRRVRRDLENAWTKIQTKFDEFTKREDLSGPAHHAQILAKELSERARKLSESDAGKKLRGAAEAEEMKEARSRLEEWTGRAADRVEEFAKSERVRDVGRTAYEAAEKLVARLQDFVDQIKGSKTKRPDDEAEPDRRDDSGEQP